MNAIYKKNKLQIITFVILGTLPLFIDSYYLDNFSYFMCWTFISLGLAVIWGMGGILSFGQTAFFGLAGAWISGRQVWLQGLPEDEVPLCGPPLEYIIDVFPFADVLNALFMGDGNCAEIPWQFLGLSMAGWSFIWFVVIISLAIVALVRSKH